MDSGVLLATMAGAGATLVAIIGGLLVSRYVALDSEQQGADRRLLEIDARRTDAQGSLVTANGEKDAYFVKQAFDDSDVIDLFIDREMTLRRQAARDGIEGKVDPLTASEVLDAMDEPGLLNSDLVEQETQRHRAETSTAITTLPPIFNPYARERIEVSNLPTWHSVRRDHGLRPKVDGIWETFWDRMVDEYRRRVQKNSLYASLDYTPLLTRGGSQATTLAIQGEINRLTQRVDEARALSQALDIERRLAQEVRDGIGTPRRLWVGLVVLGFLAVVQLVLPLLYLAPTPAMLSVSELYVLMGLFILGLIVLFVYLGHYARRLSTRARAEGGPNNSSDHEPTRSES